jgi:hypothetical protein
MFMVSDWIIQQLTDIFAKIGNIGDDMLGKTLKQFNSDVMRGINSIQIDVIRPIAYTILALFLLIELHRIIVRFEGQQGTMGVELPLKLMFKFVVFKMVIDNVGIILGAMEEVTIKIIEKIGALGTISPAGEWAANLGAIEATLEGMKWWSSIMLAMNVFILGLIVTLTLIVVKVIIIARFFELFVLTAVAPLPIATIPSDDLGIAKNFFKNYAAVLLHGVFIFIILTIMPMLVGGAFFQAGGDGIDALINMNGVLGYSVVLLIAVISSGRWAKSICNAM